jgi:sn-glycerol 3-phosphate transport system substrate-binding protein
MSTQPRGTSRLGLTTLALALLLAVSWEVHQAWARREIHFWHAMSGHLNEAVETLTEQFNAKQNDYEVQPRYMGTYAETLAAAIAAHRSKAPPHIVQVFDVGTQTMLLSGAILPVFQMMKEQGIAVDWSDFIEPVRTYYSKGGHLYSMPFNASTPILYYNKDVFRRSGLSPNKPPATWKEVGEFSKRILGAGAARCGFSTGWPSWILFENMAAWHDLPFATNRNGFGSVDTRLLINGEFQSKLIGQLVAWQESNVYRHGGRMDIPDSMFSTGECAMYLQSSASIGAFTHVLPFSWGTGQLPHWGEPYKKGTSIPGGATLWVMQELPSPDYRGVAQFFKFLAEPEQQTRWHQTTGYVTVTNASVRSLGQTNHFLKHPDQWTAFAQLTSGQNTAHTQGIRLGNFVAVRDAIEDEFENILAGKKGVQQGLNDAVAKGNEILKEFASLYN